MNVTSTKILILLSDAKKEKNKNNKLVLDATNINTGVTIACRKWYDIFV